jgi:SAM-dependent methyltransferase
MSDLAQRIARLSPAQRRLLERLAGGGADTDVGAAQEPAPPERLLTGDLVRELGDGAPVQAAVRRFYDAVNGQLDAGVARDYAHFLNYGYAADGRSERAVHTLPRDALNRNCVQLVLELVGDCELVGRRVLDVGCGRGGAIAVLHRFFAPRELVGLDLSPAAIAFCRRAHRFGGARFVCGDAEALPFPAHAFDAVVNVESSHSYPDVGTFYAEVQRVLEPGGVFLYADTMPTTRVAARLEQIAALGFRLELERDITANVLRSCDELAEVHAQAFTAGNAPDVLGEFLAVPGSENYEQLRCGRSLYGIWRLRTV